MGFWYWRRWTTDQSGKQNALSRTNKSFAKCRIIDGIHLFTINNNNNTTIIIRYFYGILNRRNHILKKWKKKLVVKKPFDFNAFSIHFFPSQISYSKEKKKKKYRKKFATSNKIFNDSFFLPGGNLPIDQRYWFSK